MAPISNSQISPPKEYLKSIKAAGAFWKALTYLGIVATGLALVSMANQLPIHFQLFAWSLVLGVSAILVRRGRFRLFGPVLFYDLLTTGRRGRYVMIRLAYALVLLLVLYKTYASSFRSIPARSVNAAAMARFAQDFFYTFMGTQISVIFLFTPAYCAGAIADEKDRKTIEFLLATDLTSREIVLSKLLARVSNLVLLILTGLPIISLTELWGGVEPDMVIAGFIASAVTLISLASLSILNSVYARTAREAIFLTYLTAIAYLGLSALAQAALKYPILASYPLSVGSKTWLVTDLIDVIGSGNIGVAAYQLTAALKANMATGTVIPALLTKYALFHGSVSIVCVCWAIGRLRQQTFKWTRTQNGPAKISQVFKRPALGLRPMLWKEIFASPGLSFNRFGRVLVAMIMLASFIPAVWIVGQYLLGVLDLDAFWFHQTFYYFNSGPSQIVGNAVNQWVRIVGTLVACLTLLGVAAQAASSVAGERERQTLDSLLTTSLRSDEILWAKRLGSILSLRWALAWLCFIWFVGLLSGGLDKTSVPWLIAAWLVYADFLAVLGLWFSIESQGSGRATLATLITASLVGGAHWLVWLIGCIPGTLMPSTWESNAFFDVWLYGLTPPAGLGWLAFRADNFVLPFFGSAWHVPWNAFRGLFAGLVFWSLSSFLLWKWTQWRFRDITKRNSQNTPGSPQDCVEIVK